MRDKRLVLTVLALLVVLLIGFGAPCSADGDDPPVDNGDPVSVPPACQSLEPTSGILSVFWMILMAMAFQLAL
jgi:hypothetical protein